MNFRKILSYLYPIRIKKVLSKYHTLELTWNNGKLMLDSAMANYSYGNLHKVFQMAFKQSRLEMLEGSQVLLLGLGGGSIIEILEKEYDFNGSMTAIEIDSEVISLYEDMFKAKHTTVATIIQEDASKWVAEFKHDVKYDLIICDIFIDLAIPDFIRTIAFYEKLKLMLNSGGSIYVNSIKQKHINELNATFFYPTFKQIEKYEFFDLNEVFVLKTGI